MTQEIYDRFITQHKEAISKQQRYPSRELARRVLTAPQYLDFLTDCIDYMCSLENRHKSFKTDFEMFP